MTHEEGPVVPVGPVAPVDPVAPVVPVAFDVTGPLPSGTTLLEASAGTGKTWTIAALVTRWVAEGEAELDEMLVVTFTRAASQELRDRVRAQLVAAERCLGEVVDGIRDLDDAAARVGDDALLAHLLRADHAALGDRRRRLRAAVGGFDGATIATIHQFCQLVLRGLGVAGDTDADATLVEDLEELLTEVVDDLYLARFADLDGTPPFDRPTALRLARDVVADPRARVEPQAALEAAPDEVPAQRVRFALDVLAELDRRKRRLGVLSYDDLLGQLADALAAADAPARARMRHRWKVALVDEFQDTDPVQWQVFERAFHGAATLVLIGDPKQAVYAFRGGDVTTYLRAAELATTRGTLAVNRRSDAPLVAATTALLGGAQLGDEQIAVHDVSAHHREARLLVDDQPAPPLRLRVVRHEELGVSAKAWVKVDQWREHVARDLARDVRRQLGDPRVRFCGRRLEAADVAVLAHTRRDLLAAQAALAEVGVPAVVGAGGSVFSTPAAVQWLTLLEALEQPHRADRVRAAALTAFVGLTAVEVDAGGDAAAADALTDRLAERVRALAEVLAQRGVAAVLECAVLAGLVPRVLGTVGGERLLTDLRHVGEALHRVAVEERLGVVGLLGWLREQMADDKVEVASERTRRLDSDAAAVQLVTIHGAKGLQYGLVYLPGLWDRWVGDRGPDVPLYHDAEGRRCRDVGGPGPHREESLRRHRAEEAGESLRLLYVALTRAQSQVVAWWAPAKSNTPSAPLHRVLFGRRPGDPVVPDTVALPDADRLANALAGWRDAGALTPELAVPVEPTDEAPVRDRPPLAAREARRRVDTAWRRTSYSSLSAAAGTGSPSGVGVGDGAAAGDITAAGPGGPGDRLPPLSEPEDAPELRDGDVLDAPDAGGALADDGRPLTAVPSPMADLPVGATFGSLVHAVLEHADPAADDWSGELRRHLDEQAVWWPLDVDRDALVTALVAACDTPLGPLAGERTLRQVGLDDRLREMEFELPLAGGDHPSHAPGSGAPAVLLGHLAPLLRAHLATDDPLLGYADTLEADPALAGQELRGYLTGSIDVVLRHTGDDGVPRFVTVDYKTNWVGGDDGVLTAYDYRPRVLAAAMGHSDYPLQALLYTVVLHRYLRWRLAGYDPDVHLGGVLYLYLRGLCGPETPRVDGQPCGVFAWRPPTPLVTALSDLLDGRRP
ncbi:UvrD-helicase domain-containing protein [Nocardioides perillae]|uniref:RecBCD enzyme subunit RecB n=1 Tax=Nocardioides perillae TaxID=1119534 RepID=A0A7Y9RSA2_9ACTN|nr:exodeoxyribonuclease V beta subunit [Nocardioides perillae]